MVKCRTVLRSVAVLPDLRDNYLYDFLATYPSLMVNLSPAIVLSIIAVILSVIAIRRQRIPTRYELERRIREYIQQKNPKMEFSAGKIQYSILSITVEPKNGFKNRILEYICGEPPSETSIYVSTNISGTESLDDIKCVSETSARVDALALTIQIESIDPEEVYAELIEIMREEIPSHVLETTSH